MSTADLPETEPTVVTLDTTVTKWSSAVVASLVAGVAMGGLMQFVMGVMPTVASLYGYETVAAGWVAHLFHSVVFAIFFAGAASLPVLEAHAARFPTSVLAGVVFGFGDWVFGSVFAMPFWLSSIGMEAPAAPNIAPTSLLAHTVYGVVLCVVYPVLTRLPP